jgi:hypothetical protein
MAGALSSVHLHAYSAQSNLHPISEDDWMVFGIYIPRTTAKYSQTAKFPTDELFHVSLNIIKEPFKICSI